MFIKVSRLYRRYSSSVRILGLLSVEILKEQTGYGKKNHIIKIGSRFFVGNVDPDRPGVYSMVKAVEINHSQ